MSKICPTGHFPPSGRCISAKGQLPTLHEPLLGFGDDAKDFFHQFVSAILQRWACCIIALDPAKVAAGALDAELVSILENCGSMGTAPMSNLAQRFSTDVMRGQCTRCCSSF